MTLRRRAANLPHLTIFPGVHRITLLFSAVIAGVSLISSRFAILFADLQ